MIMGRPLFSIVDKDGKYFKFQTGGGCYQWFFFEKDLDMLNATCEMLNASKVGGKYKPYSVKQVV
jgi:hypothetical protein